MWLLLVRLVYYEFAIIDPNEVEGCIQSVGSSHGFKYCSLTLCNSFSYDTNGQRMGWVSAWNSTMHPYNALYHFQMP